MSKKMLKDHSKKWKIKHVQINIFLYFINLLNLTLINIFTLLILTSKTRKRSKILGVIEKSEAFKAPPSKSRLYRGVRS